MYKIASIVLLLLAAALGFAYFGSHQNYTNAVNLTEVKSQEVDYFKDELGRANARLENIEVDEDNVGLLKEHLDSLGFENTKLKNLLAITSFGTSSQNVVVVVDTARQVEDTVELNTSFDNGFLSFEQKIRLDLITLRFELHGEYQYRTRISILHEQDKRFFRPDITTVRLVNEDPNAIFEGESSIVIKEDKKRFRPGLHVGVTYLDKKIRPVISAGLNINL